MSTIGLKIALIALLILIIAVIFAYNQAIMLRNYVREAFSTMDVYLKKRWDLVPSLVECVKGYAQHESKLLEEITKIRNKNYGDLNKEEKFSANKQLISVLPQIFAVVENYPALKAGENYINLMQQLKQTEEDIANSRKYYNGTVRQLNVFLEMFPTNIIGLMFGIKKEKMFEIEAEQRENIKVSL